MCSVELSTKKFYSFGTRCVLGFTAYLYGQGKFHLSAHNYEGSLERMSNSSQSTHPVGQVLWKELLEEVILHITPLCSLLHTFLKDKCMCLQDE